MHNCRKNMVGQWLQIDWSKNISDNYNIAILMTSCPLIATVPEVPGHDASWAVHCFAFAAGRLKQVQCGTFRTPSCSVSSLLGRTPPPHLQHEQSHKLWCVSEVFASSTSLNKRSDVALSPPEEDLFECDIEKSLEADFALSGTLIHTRWVFFFFYTFAEKEAWHKGPRWNH